MWSYRQPSHVKGLILLPQHDIRLNIKSPSLDQHARTMRRVRYGIPARLGNLTAPEEAERYTTLGGDRKRGPDGVDG